MQNRSIMSLELQYLLKTTCKTEAEGREGSGGSRAAGFRGDVRFQSFLCGPDLQVNFTKKKQNNCGHWNVPCTSLH